MDSIELWNGTARALIDPQGAWVTNLSDENGDILFPKRNLTASDGSTKVRGGLHVCVPNFGPGGESGLAQHGFGRTLPWKVIEQEGTSIAVLELEGGNDEYSALRSSLTFTLYDNALTITLDLENTAAYDLRVAPGFHPYFMLMPDEDKVKIGAATYTLADIAGTEFVPADVLQLQTKKRTIKLQSLNLPTWAIWTDQLGSYVCVEPTANGYAFTQNEGAADETLQPGQVATYSCTISW